MAVIEIPNLESPNLEIPTDIDELKQLIKKFNSRAGQMKMDLHDLAEGLPTDYDKLVAVAAETYAIFKQIDDLKQYLKQLENPKS